LLAAEKTRLQKKIHFETRNQSIFISE